MFNNYPPGVSDADLETGLHAPAPEVECKECSTFFLDYTGDEVCDRCVARLAREQREREEKE